VLLGRGIERIRAYAPRHHGIDVAPLADASERIAVDAERVERSGEPLPPLDPPRIEPR
jgi:hypothetical protein